MLGQILRIAVAGSWMNRSADRWRAVLIAACTAILVIAASGFLAVGSARLRAEQRIASRGYTQPSEDEDPDYLRSVSYDVAPDGSPITVVSWFITKDAFPPHGFPHSTRQGIFYLSPSLTTLVRSTPLLYDRYRGHTAERFDERFTGQADELIAYRLVDRPDGLSDRLTDRPGTDTVGDLTLPEFRATIAPTVLLLLLPGIGLVWAASSVSAPLLRRQLEVLDILGASRGALRSVAAFHSLAMAIPGIALGTAAWAIWTRRLTTIPLTDLAVRPGDLTLSGIQTTGIALSTAVLYGGILTALSTRRSRPRDRPRDFIPLLAIGATMQLLAPFASERRGFALLLGGVVATIAGTPPIIATLYRWTGRHLARLGCWQTVIAGRQMATAANGTARAHTAWVSLLIMVPLAGSWISTVRLTDALTRSATSVVQAGGEDIALLRQWIDDRVAATSAQVAVEPLSPEDPREPQLHLIGNCEALSEDLDLSCSIDGTFTIPRDVPDLARFEERASARLPEGFLLDQSVLLYFDGGDRQRENALRSLAVTTPGLSVVSDLTSIKRESPLVSYVVGTLVSMTAITVLALTLSIVGHAVRSARGRQRLAVLGAAEGAIAVVAACEAMTIVGIAAAATIPSTGFSLWSMTRLEPSTVIPQSVLWWVAAAMVAGTAGAGGAAAIASRRGDLPPE